MTKVMRRRDDSGFSLLEVLVATAVLAFGILGMAQLFLLAIEQNRRAAQHTQSSNMLQHRLEQLRQVDFCVLDAAADAAGGAWVADTPIAGENMGNTYAVFADRADPLVGQGGRDWVLERRLVGYSQGLTEIEQQPVEQDTVILIELRGYRRGYRQQYQTTRNQHLYMSVYRTNRSTNTCS